MSSRSTDRARWQVVHRGVPYSLAGVFVVGRGDDCQLRLDDMAVSRRHCVLTPTAMGVQVVDEGSRHGTALNGERLSEPAIAQQGDRITVGNEVLVVRDMERLARAELDTVRRTPEAFRATGSERPQRQTTGDIDPLVGAVEDVEQRLAGDAGPVPRALIRLLLGLVQARPRLSERMLQRAACALLDGGGVDPPVDDVIRMHAARGVELARPTTDALVRAVAAGARLDAGLTLAYVEQLARTPRSEVLAGDVAYCVERLRASLRRG
jgi:predicted component of type VI protein secretion system